MESTLIYLSHINLGVQKQTREVKRIIEGHRMVFFLIDFNFLEFIYAQSKIKQKSQSPHIPSSPDMLSFAH